MDKRKIGLGDGLFLLALGCMNDTGTYIRTLWMGLLLAAGYSAFLLFRKKSRKTAKMSFMTVNMGIKSIYM